MLINVDNMTIELDAQRGELISLKIGGCERLFGRVPIFKIGLRRKNGELIRVSAYDANRVEIGDGFAVYGGFDGDELTVRVSVFAVGNECHWYISAEPASVDTLIEWVDFPLLKLPPLKDNADGGGKILFPYNEGVIVSDNEQRKKSWFSYKEPQYPSHGSFSVFPNMICSQLISYIFDDASLYIGAHDKKRGVKQIDFYEEDGGIVMLMRLYGGRTFGERFENDYPIVFSALDGSWESSAEKYRAWFEENLPPKAKKIKDNSNLPDWYSDSPLVVTYPVRGFHDMDDMKPNKLFPYMNALDVLGEIKNATKCRIMALLMHWEGTAPWAPPYVWPPFGGEDSFNLFADALHKENDILGVYCSGFGYTLHSNLLDYSKEEEFSSRGLDAAMCAGADGVPRISNICTAQRKGYDICPASELGRLILSEAYDPLFASKADYAQILDQNHGGGQYFCLSDKHGHPPAPGEWMTRNMQDMLTEWGERADGKVFGCESAASEPFVGNLLFNDNRYELNYDIGTPVPLYSYIYHEYIRNFMGNQVCCPFPSEVDTLRIRLAYSFSIGDSMTLVLTPNGDLLSSWSTRDFEHFPDKKRTFTLIKNLHEFYSGEGKKYLYCGRMIKAPAICCDTVTLDVRHGYTVTLPKIFAAAYEASDGSRVTVAVNPWDDEIKFLADGKDFTIPPLSARLITLN